jgi:hypothetical protein
VVEFSAPVRKKVASLIRLLGSNQEGERLGSAHGLDRTLKGSGFDFHTLADLVEQANGDKLSEAEMKKLYDAGYEVGHTDGVAAAEAKVSHDEDGFRNVNGHPSWHAMAVFCQDCSGRLRPNEADFVDDMAGWTTWREPTPKQAKWLRSIYARLGGKLPP